MRNQYKVNATEKLDECQAMKADYDGLWATLHRAIGDYMIPQKSAINSIKPPDTSEWTEGIFDSTAIHACQTFSAGCFDYMLSGEWFGFEAPSKNGEKNAIADDWYRRCAEITLEAINGSNWNLKIQEHLQDRNSFGVAHIDVMEGKKGKPLVFSNAQVGKFFIRENDEGYVDAICELYNWTPKKIVDKFGIENVSSEVKDAYEDVKQRGTKKIQIWHYIAPREVTAREFGKVDGLNKEFESCWLEEKAKSVLEEGGFDGQNFVVSRFAQWGDEAYGWSPAVLALPTVRTLNDLMKSLIALGEVKLWPRALVPEGVKDVIDWGAGGITVYPDTLANKPEIWGDGGDYQVGKDLVVELRQMIKDVFHVDLFKALAERTKQMTATEVLELVQEKLINFRPTFARFTTETLGPVLNRVFSLLFSQGMFPPVPSEVVVEEAGMYSVPMPKAVYISKIAKALKSLESRGILEFQQQVAFLLELDPHLLADNYDLGKMVRTLGDNQSLPTDLKRPDDEREQIQQARAQQQAEMQAAETAKTGSEAARNMGGAPPEMQEQMAGMLGG
jgi:hypothetical protein